MPVIVDSLEKRTMRKIRFRILPLVFLLYIISFLDRANVAYAKLTMSVDLGFSEAAYGLGLGLFFVGYPLLEIPGALIVQKWGARSWVSRLLIAWGICTILIGFVRTANEFYLARFLLGVAQGGFWPGMIVYLSQWFPSGYRARATARFAAAHPVAMIIGGPIAGVILQLNWLGLPGWSWVFILEGIPAVVVGFAVFFIMPNWPREASWLKPEEKEWVVDELEMEKQRKAALGVLTIRQVLRHPAVLLFALIHFLGTAGMYPFIYWLPTTIQKASGLPAHLAAIVSGLPFVFAVMGQLLNAWSSDRRGERCLHTGIPLIVAAVIFPITTVPGMSFGWVLFWLCISSAFIYGFGPSFWVLPTVTLGESGAAVAVGCITVIGNIGGFVGPAAVGWILTTSAASLSAFFLSFCFLGAGLAAVSLRPLVARQTQALRTAESE